MRMVVRFRIERLTDMNGTEYYDFRDGVEFWTRSSTDAVEFSTEARAWARADRVGGSVSSFSRPATALEAMMLERPTTQIHLEAAE